MRCVLLAVVVPIFVILVGCEPPQPTAEIFPTVPAAGVLTYKGQPLAKHHVTFDPMDGRRAASGVTDAEGKFILGTNDTGDGAVVGIHTVTIVAAPPVDTVEPGQEGPGMMPIPQSTIPEKFSNKDTSGLTQTIPESGDREIKIDLP